MMYPTRHLGYTLLELIVVLALLAVAATVVAPSLVPPRLEDSSSLRVVIGRAREVAVLRGEMIRLRIDRSGAWHASAASSPQTEPLMSGRLADTRGPVDLDFSPLGTCALTPETAPTQALAALDPLTCEVRTR